MAVPLHRVVNETYEPGDTEEQVLELMKEGRESGDPWGRLNPKYVSDRVDTRRQYAQRALDRLSTAGWVDRVATGLYEFVADPREENGY